MKIAVCLNHVPDTAAKINIAESGKLIDEKGITFVINPYDEFAVEEALKTKEKFGGEVTVISVGTEASKESIRKAIAMGADNGILLKTSNFTDANATAYAFAEEIKNYGADLVFIGKQSVDMDYGVEGQLIASYLDYNFISVVTALEIDANSIKAEKEIEGGKEVVLSKIPIVITTQKGLNEPRYASLKGIMAAKKKPIEEKEAVLIENKVEIINLKKPEPKQPGRIVGSDVSAVPELVKLLREEAKVI